MRRFFIAPENIAGSTAVLAGPEARHISTVLRLSTGIKIILFDGSGSYYEAVLTKISPSRVESKIVSITPYIETAEDFHPALHLAIGLLKGKKWILLSRKSRNWELQACIPFAHGTVLLMVMQWDASHAGKK